MTTPANSKTNSHHGADLRGVILFAFFFNKFIYFIYLFLAVLGLRCCAGLSLVAGSRGYSSLWCADFSLQWLPLLRGTGSRCTGFSNCVSQAQQFWLTGSRAQAQ